jgi:hypothetical protein
MGNASGDACDFLRQRHKIAAFHWHDAQGSAIMRAKRN